MAGYRGKNPLYVFLFFRMVMPFVTCSRCTLFYSSCSATSA
jgi:hypothetical protein